MGKQHAGTKSKHENGKIKCISVWQFLPSKRLWNLMGDRYTSAILFLPPPGDLTSRVYLGLGHVPASLFPCLFQKILHSYHHPVHSPGPELKGTTMQRQFQDSSCFSRDTRPHLKPQNVWGDHITTHSLNFRFKRGHHAKNHLRVGFPHRYVCPKSSTDS